MYQKPLNILFLCSWYPNPESNSNGIFIKRHAQALALKHKVTVLFVKSIHTEQLAEIQTEEGNLKEILFFYPKSKFNFPFISSVFKFLKFKSHYKKQIDLLDNTFDFIHVNTIFPAAIPALYAIKKNPKAKLIITEHWSGYYPEDGNYTGFLMKYYTQKLVALANQILVISDKLKKAMQNHQLNGNYHLINNVVDTKVFKPTSERIANEKLEILHVSSLVDREKNISGIIEIAKKLKEKQFSFKLTLIGYNENEIAYHKENAYKFLTQNEIEFVGYKKPNEIASYMNKSSVFLLFSNFEGMPVVLLESMACGLPVITTAVGQVKEMVKPDFGVILKTNNVYECVEKLCTFNKSRFASAQVMHKEIASNYGYEEVCESITKIYLTN